MYFHPGEKELTRKRELLPNMINARLHTEPDVFLNTQAKKLLTQIAQLEAQGAPGLPLGSSYW